MAKYTKSGECKICGINTYEELNNKPDLSKYPCGIDRTDVEELKASERVKCPYEASATQKENWEKYNFDPAGLGQINYE